ncbi:hypothetical protein J6590_043339 [Homalodisca vitripennis]|nr:hypothetical protein J6590_043339 [Homalodisca vitripennis]
MPSLDSLTESLKSFVSSVTLKLKKRDAYTFVWEFSVLEAYEKTSRLGRSSERPRKLSDEFDIHITSLIALTVTVKTLLVDLLQNRFVAVWRRSNKKAGHVWQMFRTRSLIINVLIIDLDAASPLLHHPWPAYLALVLAHLAPPLIWSWTNSSLTDIACTVYRFHSQTRSGAWSPQELLPDFKDNHKYDPQCDEKLTDCGFISESAGQNRTISSESSDEVKCQLWSAASFELFRS